MIEVVELFQSFQGEGPSIGKPATFLRLRRCNRQCEFCDTKYSWDKNDPGYQNYSLMSADDIVEQVTHPLLVITGGEPLLWQRELEEIVWHKLLQGVRIEIETNGSISPKLARAALHYIVSPKPPFDMGILKEFVRLGVTFKFVVHSEIWEPEMKGIWDIQKSIGIPNSSMYIMPVGVKEEIILEGLRTLALPCQEAGWTLAPRLQILMYGNKRGV